MCAIAAYAASLLSGLTPVADCPEIQLRANGASRPERKTAKEVDEAPNPGRLKASGVHNLSMTLSLRRARRSQ
jgi:hypothetical protein